MNTRHLATGLLASMALLASTHSVANTSQQMLFPQHNYSQFTLPTIGQTGSDVLQHYGQPAKRQQGANGVDMWDYGSFRVIFRDNAVSHASMW